MSMPAPSWHVLGAGAIGGLWALRIARTGIPVTLVAHDDAAASRTLTLREGDRTFTHTFAQVPAGHPGSVQRLLVATKAGATASALTPLLPILTAATPVLLLQNGMGVDEWLRLQRPDICLLTGITTDGVHRPRRDLLLMAGTGATVIGSDDPSCTATAREIADSLAQCGSPVQCVSDIRRRRWQKLAINCAINPLTARYRCRNGELLENPEALATMQAVCRETAEVIQAEGMPAEAGALFQLACAAAAGTATNISSMRADVEAGRQTEIAFLNGYVVQHARAHGIATPVNTVLLQEILAISPP